MIFRLNQNEKLFVDLKSLSDFRTPLMGISIILVLLCHAKMNGANLPCYILKILNLGNWGVDIFFLLSGIGMYFSITKKNIQNQAWFDWYKRRFYRVLIPYFILETPYWIWYCIDNNEGVISFLYYISMLSFWCEHIGLWFLALLIPLYIITPVLYKIFNTRYGVLYLILLLTITLTSPLIVRNIFNNNIICNILGVIVRVPCFLIGLYYGKKIKEGKNVNFLYLILLLLAFHIIPFLSLMSKSWIWGLICSVLFVKILSSFSSSLKILEVFGKYTLEIYISLDVLTNLLSAVLEKGTLFWLLTILGSCSLSFIYVKIKHFRLA